MKIKQTVKRLFLGLALVAGLSTALTPVVAADCAGVQTSIINCTQKQTGLCTNNINAFEGTKPTSAAEEKAYQGTYNHEYGKCADGSTPSNGVENSGIWAILLLVINILTAGIGVVAVGGIVYASIIYTTAGGDANQTKKAMTIIADIVIGVVAYALMYSVLNFLVPGGLFHN